MNSDEEFFAKQRGLMMIGTILQAYAWSSLQLCSFCGSCLEMFLFAVCTVGESNGKV